MKISASPALAPIIGPEGPAQIRELVLALASIPDPDIRAQALDHLFANHSGSQNLDSFGDLLLAIAADPAGGAAQIFDMMLGFLTIPERPRYFRFRDAILDLASDLTLRAVVLLAVGHARLGRLWGRSCGLSLDQTLVLVRLFLAFRDLARARFRGKELERDLIIARGIFQTLNYRDNSARGTGGRVPAAAAGRLTSAAVRILPAEHRPRYQEEYRAELADLARAGLSQRAQAAYAARLLVSACQLRNELRVPRRRRAIQ